MNVRFAIVSAPMRWLILSLLFWASPLQSSSDPLLPEGEQDTAKVAYQPLNKSWLRVEIGIIGAASADILETSMQRVQEEGYQGLLIVLDTPGGALEATRQMFGFDKISKIFCRKLFSYWKISAPSVFSSRGSD